MELNENCSQEAIPLNGVLMPSTSSLKARGSLQRLFLHDIKRNDICGVRALARQGKLDDSQSCDELGRTALMVAIDKGNYDMIECLLQLQHDVGDALFHAVGVNNAHAVRALCKNLPDSVKLEVVNGYPSSHYYPPVMTPLLLAGKNNNFEIIKVLLEHGANMPHLTDLLSLAKNDGYLKFLAMLQWYEAASSEAYILLTSDNPLDTIFKLGESLQEVQNSSDVPLFDLDCERIQANLADLSTKLLSMARDNNEIGVLLRGGEKASRSPKVPQKIRQALDMDSFKKFVCHPSCQAYMNVQWQIPHPHCLAKCKGQIYSYLYNILIIVLYPFLCVAYILLPWKRLQFMKKPKTRFLVHAGSRLSLLLILVLSTRSWLVDKLLKIGISRVNVTNANIVNLYIVSWTGAFTLVDIVILLWIIGMTVQAVKQIWAQGASFYFKSGWHVMDFLQLVLYWIFVISSCVAVDQSSRLANKKGILKTKAGTLTKDLFEEGNISFSMNATNSTQGLTLFPEHVEGTNQTLYTWSDFQAQLISEAAFALANVLSFLQILHHLIAFSLLGPLLISFIGMIYDVLKFFMIFGFVLVSFSIGMTQLYHKLEALDYVTCRMGGNQCPETPFLNFGQSMSSLFWSIFNMVDLENLKTDKDLAITQTIGSIMYASFMLIASIILLNALIAMMSNTYTRVEENSEIEWKVARTHIMVEYISEISCIPPPFNLLPTTKAILGLYRYLQRKCCPTSSPDLQPRVRKDDEGNQDASYKEVSRALGERCLRALDMERMQLKTSRDIKMIKTSVENFSCEMSEMQQQLNIILDILNQKTGKTEGAPETKQPAEMIPSAQDVTSVFQNASNC